MAESEVSLGFITELNPSEKVQYGRDRRTNIFDNSTEFITPKPPLTEIDTVNDDLEAAIQAAENGNKQQKDFLAQTAVPNWDKKMRKLADYVDDVADGDTNIINL